ncbi:SDR family NAD(P)-dependent oxidoreductase [Pseudomonas sp. FP453]|jgi:3-oxoacyl-[acyl-carrier protein] reductase|uniref:SDR family NAD(P)-dependent oxidoreductase n=1 Tax=unclassified Pseudomonas TaxID=196821 RepID=UPI000B3FE81C|nr:MULTISPECIES: SDR family oxidoreductase [unclassified Pseudomonas]MCJ7956997.1 SDR family oxidoreductase [Pseudomonas sp.]MCR4537979.1 SDR family oxidoreductase [Pseudomonas sp. 18.1.10]WLH92348.1 SDR family NAD(P)-dependent oxidoreductase [Pseudomonas sp. FP453]
MSTAPNASVIITGTSSGMGQAVAQRFQDEGWHVVAVDVTPSKQPASALFSPVVGDITREDSLTDAIDAALDGKAPLKAVINAAGIFPTSSLESFSEALYRKIFDINVLGSLNIARIGSRHLKAAGGGAIVFFASVDAFTVSKNQLLYSASKAAVVAMTRSLAIELADDNIVVNALAPGWVDTEGTRAGGRIEAAVASIPLKRAARVEEIADWVWQLSAKPGYVTGESLCIAGGVFMR